MLKLSADDWNTFDLIATITTTTTITLTTELDPVANDEIGDNTPSIITIPIKTTTTSTSSKSNVADKHNNNKTSFDDKNGGGENDTQAPQTSQSKGSDKGALLASASTEERSQVGLVNRIAKGIQVF